VEEAGIGFDPYCTVHNDGPYTIIAKITCKIKDLDTWETIYDDTHFSFPFEPGNNEVFFKEFIPEGFKTYNALFIVEHPQTGDSKDKNFSTEGSLDVTPYECISPVPYQPGPFAPAASFAEFAGLETPNVTLYCTIDDMNYNTLIYSDSVGPMDFSPHDTMVVVFAQAVVVGPPFLVTFWAEDEEGHNISHPPLEVFIYDAVEEYHGDNLGSDVFISELSTDKATIHFSLPKTTEITLHVYDATGKHVTTLASGTYGVGSHTTKWDVRDVPCGIYFVHLITPGYSKVLKLTLVR
jgi:hypothetical protein